MHRRGHGNLQHSGWKFHQELDLLTLLKNFRDSKKHTAGGNIFGSRFPFATVGQQSDPQVQRISHGAPAGAPITGSGRQTDD